MHHEGKKNSGQLINLKRYDRNWKKYFIIFTLLTFSKFIHSQTIIDSVLTSVSTCSNNGQVTIYASNNLNPSLVYAIVSGPVITPIQNNNIFSSLFPGNYTANVYDSNLDSVAINFTIGGNYQLPHMLPTVVPPSCATSTDGAIAVNPDSNYGLQPFLFAITAPISIGPQFNSNFQNLGAGTYTIQLTDACNNIVTQTAYLGNTGTGLDSSWINVLPSVDFIGCGMVSVRWNYALLKKYFNTPLTLVYEVNGTTFSNSTILPEVLDTINFTPGEFILTDTLSGIFNGDLFKIFITDQCGVTIGSFRDSIPPFLFDISFTNQPVGCMANISLNANYYQPPWHEVLYSTLFGPLTYILTDNTTGLILDSGSCQLTACTGFSTITLPSGTSAALQIFDQCGNTFTQNIIWPQLDTHYVEVAMVRRGCMDSTVCLRFLPVNFLSPITLTVLSGPSSVGSIKPNYSWNDTIIYPFTIPSIPSYYFIDNFGIGTYTFVAEDSCGNTYSGSFEVTLGMVQNLEYSYWIKRGCLGQNIFYFNAITDVTRSYTITQLSSNNIVLQESNFNYTIDSILSIQPGYYAIEINYQAYTPDSSINGGDQPCWILLDTIFIPPYQNVNYINNTTFTCNGLTYIELLVDSTTGVAPYSYEILSGPQTFPLQSSNTFTLNQPGIYLIRVTDACGNSISQQMTIDTLGFQPIQLNGFICPGSDVIVIPQYSPYFDYVWISPAGNIIQADTLFIAPLTYADTGLYQVLNIVTINGCVDTSYGQINVPGLINIHQQLNGCFGDTFIVGNSTYNLSGIYIDTLTSNGGCDSILITTININQNSIQNVVSNICALDTFYFGQQLLTLPGNYVDTFLTSTGCDSVVQLSLNIVPIISDTITVIQCAGSYNFYGNILTNSTFYTHALTATNGCDSLKSILFLLVPNYTSSDSISATICAGESFNFNGILLNVAGNYLDTVQSSFYCDSIVNLTLNVHGVDTLAVQDSICLGNVFNFYNQTLTTTGVYYHSLTSGNGCDSIVQLSLAVTTPNHNFLQQDLCQGQTYLFNNQYLDSSGTYFANYSTVSGCDSIVELQLNINQPTNSFITATICNGDVYQFANQFETTTGIYTDTLINTLGCDSIVLLSLFVNNPTYSYGSASICIGSIYNFNGTSLSMSGNYSDTLPTNGCDSIIFLNLNVNPVPNLTLTASPQIVSPTEITTINAFTNSSNISWSGNGLIMGPINYTPVQVVINENTWIYCEVIDDNGCKQIDSILIKILIDSGPCDSTTLYIPDAITPNDDGLNDVFQIFGTNISILKLEIIDRWGNPIYTSDNINPSWNAKVEKSSQLEVYNYIITYTSCLNSQVNYKYGKVSVIR
ncbi:MAG: hypothetical protein RIQ89_1718 [Bacteroidota bacterium]|jgi:gliding motility-associated-like protein